MIAGGGDVLAAGGPARHIPVLRDEVLAIAAPQGEEEPEPVVVAEAAPAEEPAAN